LHTRYMLWIDRVRKLLWWLVIVGLIASLPLAYKRVQTERSTRNVELVFDYRDLLDAAQYRPDPQSYIRDHLRKLKQAGVGSIAVYESTLEELEKSGRIRVYKPNEYALLTGNPDAARANYTYLLFTSAEARDKLLPIVLGAYRDRLKVQVREWTVNNRQGLVIELPYDEANTKPMEPDPLTLDMLRDEKFRIVARLSNRIQPFTAAELDRWLARLSEYGVRRIVFDGTAVTGYDANPAKSHVAEMAELMRKYGMGAAIIDRLKAPQQGFTVSFARKLDNDVVRLFPLLETEVNLPPDQIADKLVLAAKDRNLRMLYLNTKPAKNLEKGYFDDYMDNIYEALVGSGGAIDRIEKAGYRIGEAHAFVEYGKSLWPLKPVLLLGGTALIALTIGCFFTTFVPALFAVGTAGVAGLYALSPTLALQAAAFGVAVCAPTLATIVAIRHARARREKAADVSPSLWYAASLLVRTSALTSIGIFYVVGLLSGVTYYLVLEQFRGVQLLHVLPIVLVGAYVLFFEGTSGMKEVLSRIRDLLFANVRVVWVLLAGIGLAAMWYYLTRTGNEGQASELEKSFRALLEQTLGVRPRSKEFLFAHPLFVIGAYWAVKSRAAVYLFVAGVMGQLSMVDTFAHLHTPLYISFIRAGYGVLFGIAIGLIGVAVLRLVARGWRKWSPLLNG